MGFIRNKPLEFLIVNTGDGIVDVLKSCERLCVVGIIQFVNCHLSRLQLIQKNDFTFYAFCNAKIEERQRFAFVSFIV